MRARPIARLRARWTLVALLLLAPALRAQEQGPRLRVEPREVQLGALLDGAAVERTLALTNAGDAPLVITRVEPSCGGCTVVGALPPAIAPGGQATLTVRFDSTGRRGPQRLAVWLYSNDPTQQDRGRGCTEVTLVADVGSLFTLRPEGAFFGEVVRDGAPRQVVVTITCPGRDVALRPIAAPEGLDVTLDAGAGPGGLPSTRVIVTLPPDVSAGELHHDLVLETGVPEQPRLTLPVVALVSPRVAGPRKVELFDVRRSSGVTKRVSLERRDGLESGIPVREVLSPLPWLAARVEPLTGARSDLVLEVAPDAPPGPFVALVEVLLDDPQEPLLRVPVLGEVLPRVRVEPPVLLLAPGQEGVLLVHGGKVREARAKAGGLTVRAEPPRPADRARARVVVTAPEGWDGAPTFVVLETDVEGEERVAVPVRRAGG